MTNINLNYVYYLVFYFIIYSIGGWILESIYKSIYDKKIINSGFMYGPYCPIYGFGTLIMIFSLNNITDNIILLFTISFIVLSFWEYIVAILLEKIFNTTYWDYSQRKFNIKGRVCLLNSVYWGILGVIFMDIIHPFISQKATLIPLRLLIIIDSSILIIMITDFVISAIKIASLNLKFEQIKDLNEKIKDKIKASKNSIETFRNDEESILLKKLELLHNKKRISLYKQLMRTKKIFPTMKSEVINKILNEKIDVKELKDKIKTETKLIKEKTKEIKKKK